MVSHLFFYQLMLIALVWLCVMLQWAWQAPPSPRARYRWSPHPHGQNATVSSRCAPQKLNCHYTDRLIQPQLRLTHQEPITVGN